MAIRNLFLAGSLAVTVWAPLASGACFDPAIEDGYGYKDSATQSLIFVQQGKPTKTGRGDTIIGVGYQGRYFGCVAKEMEIRLKSQAARKFGVFLQIGNSLSSQDAVSVRGYELDISSESRRVLAGRTIQLPWDVVDRSSGVTAKCASSSAIAFEAFLYQILRSSNSRRCTAVEIVNFVGEKKQAPLD